MAFKKEAINYDTVITKVNDYISRYNISTNIIIIIDKFEFESVVGINSRNNICSFILDEHEVMSSEFASELYDFDLSVESICAVPRKFNDTFNVKCKRNSQKVMYNGFTYPSIQALSRDLGVSSNFIKYRAEGRKNIGKKIEGTFKFI